VAIPRFFVSPEALSSTGTAILTGGELHHLRVRRLRVGSELVLCDGIGRQRRGIVAALDHRRAVIRVTANDLPDRESALRLVLAQALLKADKLDLVIEKATELGVSELLVFTCERSVSRAAADRRPRWNRVARSAAKQCQRSTVPRIEGPMALEDVLRRTDPLRLFFWEARTSGGFPTVEASSVGSVLTVVGPEGGFSVVEAERAAHAGFRIIGLAPRILRAETAAVVAVTLCQFLWGDLAHTQRQTLPRRHEGPGPAR
jgi:16S rRNA (uracil1498-N3)-methyltransferase